jgi:hypothetical protein
MPRSAEAHAVSALEVEGLRDHAHSQDAALLSTSARNHRPQPPVPVPPPMPAVMNTMFGAIEITP